MSSEPSPPKNYWVPGWEGVLSNGTKVRTVRASELPPRFLQRMAKENLITKQVGTPWNGTVWILGREYGDRWEEMSELPIEAYTTGSATPGNAAESVAVPISDFEEANEFGPVSP